MDLVVFKIYPRARQLSLKAKVVFTDEETGTLTEQVFLVLTESSINGDIFPTGSPLAASQPRAGATNCTSCTSGTQADPNSQRWNRMPIELLTWFFALHQMYFLR
jgi:hypothetical protein